MKLVNKYIFGLFALLALLSACSIREDVTNEPPTVADTKVRFELFTKAGTYGLPVSRAGAEESTVDRQPWVLVFQGTGGTASFVEAVRAELYNNKTYVYLEEQTGVCQLLILANPPSQFYVNNVGYAYTVDNFADVLGGHDLTYACQNLLTESLNNPQNTVPYVGQKLPMSDLVSIPKIAVSVTIPQINLERVVGKIVVRNTDPDFILEGVTSVMNAPKQGMFYNLTGILQQNIGAGNLIEYRESDEQYSADIVEAEMITATEQSTKTNPLYLYESHTQTNDTYLIIRGTYKGGTYFYKMAFVDDDLNVLSILRNTEYVFTITSVRGEGFATVADAKKSLASNTNLDFTVLVRDDSSYEMMSNNEYYLGVSNSHFEVYAPAGTGETYTAVTLITDCKTLFPDKRKITSLTSGLEIVSPADGIIPINTTAACDVQVKMAAGFTTGEIEVYLGNLRKVITVTRKDRVASGATTITEFIENGYYISAHVEDYNNHKWLQLAPGDGIVRNDPDFIYVDDGKITLKVERGIGSVRDGTIYVSARKDNKTQKIKVYITQATRQT